jgi:hypothetical protein
VALLAPVPAVVVEPGVYRLLVGREQLALRASSPSGISGERSSIRAYFLAVGSETLTALAIAAIGSPPLRPLAYILYLVHADHSPLALLTS